MYISRVTSAAASVSRGSAGSACVRATRELPRAADHAARRCTAYSWHDVAMRPSHRSLSHAAASFPVAARTTAHAAPQPRRCMSSQTAAEPASTTVSDGSAAPDASRSWLEPLDMNPREVVASLSAHIIGQTDAKRAIAIALRNRWRRLRTSGGRSAELQPRNILMVGPTGCGKTEIARRLAKMCRAPFVKVEATKFTEVGYHGRDVDTIIKDLMDASMLLVRDLRSDGFRAEVSPAVEARLVEALTGPGAAEDTVASFKALLKSGALEDREVLVDVPVKERNPAPTEIDVSLGAPGGGASIDLGEFMQRIMPGARGKPALTRKLMKVKDARVALTEAEIDKKLASLDLRREAVTLAEQNGIVVIDEIDKIISNKSKHSGDASAEGVQRDLLPLIEGTTVEVRRYGNVKTDHILFIASGAFHEHKPSDLLPELQGRLPIRVELKGLDADDLERILTEPKFNLVDQQRALLEVEGIQLAFERDAIKEIARMAAEINRTVENIGARRLHTVVEKIMEDISFDAPDMKRGSTVTVTKELVLKKLGPMLQRTDLSKFIL